MFNSSDVTDDVRHHVIFKLYQSKCDIFQSIGAKFEPFTICSLRYTMSFQQKGSQLNIESHTNCRQNPHPNLRL